MTLHSLSLLVLAIAVPHLLGITTGFSLRIYPAFRDADPVIQRTPSAAYRAIPQQVPKVAPQPSSRTESDDMTESSSDTKPTADAELSTPLNSETLNGGFFPKPIGMTAINPTSRTNYASLSRNLLLEPVASYRSAISRQLPVPSNNPGPLLNCSTYLECKAQLLTYLSLMSRMQKKG